MTRPKVGIIIPSLSHGGAERVASMLANRWAEWGCEVHVITFAGLVPFFTLDRRVVAYEASAGSRRLGVLDIATIFLRIRQYVAANQLETVLSFMDKYNVFAIACLAFTRTRVTVSDRSSPTRPRPVWLRVLKRAAYPQAAGVIAQTRLAADTVRAQAGVTDIAVIPNPVKMAEPGKSFSPERIVLNVGRLVPEKGQAILIRAFARVPESDWKLVILGEGPQRSRLEALVRELNMSHRVSLPGVTEDVGTWYKRASLFVLSSVSEGFPNALVEAMTHGLACISFDCAAGPSDIIDDGSSGILVPPMDEHRLVQAMTELIADPASRERLGAAALARSLDFAEEKVSQRYLSYCLGAGSVEDRCA